MVGFCELGNEPFGCLDFEEFLDYLRNYQVYKNDRSPWN